MRAGSAGCRARGRGHDRVGDPRRGVRGSLRGRRRGMSVERETEQGQDRLGRARDGAGRRHWTACGEAGILLPFVVLFVVLSLTSDAFATKVNLLNILDQQSAILIIAAAGTLVLVAGGIDLSVGATYSLAGVVAAHFALATIRRSRSCSGSARASSSGRSTALVATVLRINALITTLAMAFIVGGCASLDHEGQAHRPVRQARLRQARPDASSSASRRRSGSWSSPSSCSGSCSPGRRPGATCTRPAATPRPPGSRACGSTRSGSWRSC